MFLQCVPPQVKEQAWLVRQDMLPGLRARSFKHRNVVDPRDKLCPVSVNAQPCIGEEDLSHFYCECPGIKDLWNQLRRKILTYTDNLNHYPAITNLELLMFDLNTPKAKIRTGVWILSSFLSEVYDRKMSANRVTFDEIWEEVKEDLEVAIKCKGGHRLDQSAML